MKLLTEFETASEADTASLRLEHKGIATFVSSRHHLGFPIGSIGPPGIGLWVVLDAQYDDAMALLLDPDHTVTNALPPEEIENIRNGIQGSDMSAALEALAWLCGGLLLFVAVIYLITGLQ